MIVFSALGSCMGMGHIRSLAPSQYLLLPLVTIHALVKLCIVKLLTYISQLHLNYISIL